MSARAASPTTVLLFPRTLTKDDDTRALVDVRKELRAHTPLEVITYDSNASAIKRASAEANHPEWLTDPMGNDMERLALARALGASFYVVIDKADGRGKLDTRIGETAASVRTWSAYDQKAGDAAKFLLQQSTFALAQPLGAVPGPPTPIVTRPISVQPVPTKPAVAVAAPVIPITAPTAVIVSTPNVPAPKPPASLSPAVQPSGNVITQPAPDASTPTIAAPADPAPAPSPPIVQPPVSTTIQSPPVVRTPPIIAPAVPATVSVVPAPQHPFAPAQPAAALPAPPMPIRVKPETLIVPSPLPIPAPSQVVVTPAAPIIAPQDDLLSVRKTIGLGDDALALGNFVAAIAAYRDAINGAPLSVVPRIKLAQAYLQSDLRDKALSEAQRALQIAPGDTSVQQFLMQLDAETGSSDGAVARYQALASDNPQDPSAHLELADALWNNGALTQAESEYRTAQSLSAKQPQTAQAAASHLARLYAAQSRYDDSLDALHSAGAGGYALALGIVQNRTDTLRSTLDAAQGAFDAGKSTHEAFYKSVTDVAAQSQSLADFVVKVTPPDAFKVSHLHRVLATHLLAQQAAVLVSYVETADSALAEQASRLEKEGQTEMLTAHAAEQALGLWNTPRAEARS